MPDYMQLLQSKEHHQELILNAQQERMAKELSKDSRDDWIELGLLQNILLRLKHGFRRPKQALYQKPSVWS
ncbi:hypothetical protein HY230_12255 [Candidatus Acetothermia bacterium]|nr:hypothetical protein [Candidatus Acetothermia bacterium]